MICYAMRFGAAAVSPTPPRLGAFTGAPAFSRSSRLTSAAL